MTRLRHPYIDPPVVIDVEDVRVPEFTSAGWLLDEPKKKKQQPTPTDAAHGDD